MVPLLLSIELRCVGIEQKLRWGEPPQFPRCVEAALKVKLLPE